ncbi:MAG: trypsin-like serine protease [Methylococcales bacterium]|nr:trypsin-like serine protease [Methylococcales bacterium]
MVATTGFYTDSRYRATGDVLDGVVFIRVGDYVGSGALLYDGRALLTAAHLFNGGGETTVRFDTAAGLQTLAVSKIALHPDFDVDANNDLAVVWLDGSAPIGADRYELYRDSDEVGQTFTLAGYGAAGTGAVGVDINGPLSSTRLKAENRFDADIGTLKDALGSGLAWTPVAGTQLVADFDNGAANRDALGQLLGVNDLGLGLDEGLIAVGDSGGPALIDGRIAGVASYIASLSAGLSQPDFDAQVNSSFGEVAAWQRVSAFQPWLDQTLRANYQDAPQTPEQVETRLVEGDAGTSHAYFLLQFTGVRVAPEQMLSVDYATRDGTAVAGADYIAVNGRLNLYPGEDQAVVPVEIIGDTLPELEETFYLDVFNPVGGSFGDGAITLTAMRTIVDDDGFFS